MRLNMSDMNPIVDMGMEQVCSQSLSYDDYQILTVGSWVSTVDTTVNCPTLLLLSLSSYKECIIHVAF